MSDPARQANHEQSEYPPSADLVEAVREHLVEVLEALEGALRYRTRVAVTALAIVERELRLGKALVAEDRADVQNLVGYADDAAAVLAERIRAGRAPAGVEEYLRRSTARRLQIVNPAWADEDGDPLWGDEAAERTNEKESTRGERG